MKFSHGRKVKCQFSDRECTSESFSFHAKFDIDRQNGLLTPICELWTKNPQTGNMVECHLWTKNPHKFFLKNSKRICLPSKTIQQKFFL